MIYAAGIALNKEVINILKTYYFPSFKHKRKIRFCLSSFIYK